MPDLLHGHFRLANFAGILGYTGRVIMYFPAGIPLLALVALVVWKSLQEAERAKAASKPKT